MNRGLAWLLHAGTLLVGGTGVGYGVVLYCVESDDPFALVNHPSQPWLQAAHIALAPWLVFAFGVALPMHVIVHLRSGLPTRRRTGITLVALAAVMVVSGYGVQLATAPALHSAWVWSHVVSSLLFLACFVLHLLVRARRVTRS